MSVKPPGRMAVATRGHQAVAGVAKMFALADIPAPLALVGPDGRVIDANDAFHAVLSEARLANAARTRALRALAAAVRSDGDAQRSIRLETGRLTLDGKPAGVDHAAILVSARLTGPNSTAAMDLLLADTLAWETDREGRLTAVSENCGRFLGSRASSTIGRPLADVFRTRDGAPLGAPQPMSWHGAIRDVRAAVDADGQRLWFALNARPTFDRAGQFTGYVGTARDVTHLARIEADLAQLRTAQTANAEALKRSHAELEIALAGAQRSERLKARFLRNLNHEFHTPLNAIIGNAELIAMGPEGLAPEKVQEIGERIAMAGRRLSGLFDDALAMATIDSGETDLALRPCRAGEVINPELATAREWAHAAEVDAAGVVEAPDTPLIADPSLTARIVRALLDNAVKFTPAGGRIGVQALVDAKRGCMTVAVWDTGCGVAPAARAAIFEPFQRGTGDGLVASAAGQGLGLAIARAYARLQGGDLLLEKTGPRGSRFTLLLPVPCADDGTRPASA